MCAETDLEARRILADIEHVELSLLPFFRGDTYDVRRMWRDAEMVNLCDRVYVFQKPDAKNIWTEWEKRGVHDGLTIVRLEKRGRNPRAALKAA